MALEQDIAELVQASNNLTGVVEGKIKEIDKAVASAVSGIPEAVRDESHKRLYLDSINGDDNNSGLSVNSPLKTFRKASSLTMHGGVVEIYLLNDYIFSSTESIPVFYGTSVQVRSYDTVNRVKIKFSYHRSEQYPDQYFMRSFQFHLSGSIEFYLINLELPDVPSDHAAGKTYPHGASVVRTYSSGLVATPLNVRLSHVDIIVPQPEINDFHLIGNPSGITNLALAGVSFPVEWRDRNKMLHQGKLSNTLFGRHIINSASALSSDDSVQNSGKVI